jgi:hypothetical protein
MNRLRDFRKTKDIARDREEWERAHLGETEIGHRLERPREEAKKLGEMTWVLFFWQFGTFAAGVLVFISAFAVVYHFKIFPK